MVGSLESSAHPPAADRSRWPDILGEWAVRKWGSTHPRTRRPPIASSWWYGVWEGRAFSVRLDATDRTHRPSFNDFEECRRARLAAAPGEGGIPQGLVREIRPVGL